MEVCWRVEYQPSNRLGVKGASSETDKRAADTMKAGWGFAAEVEKKEIFSFCLILGVCQTTKIETPETLIWVAAPCVVDEVDTTAANMAQLTSCRRVSSAARWPVL